MPMVCSICRLERRSELEAELLRGTSLRDIEKQFGVSDSAIFRHREKCIPQVISEGREKRATFTAQSLMDTLGRIEASAWSIHDMNVADRPDTAVKALVQVAGVVDRVTKLLELAQARESVNRTSIAEILQAGRLRALTETKKQEELVAELKRLRLKAGEPEPTDGEVFEGDMLRTSGEPQA